MSRLTPCATVLFACVALLAAGPQEAAEPPALAEDLAYLREEEKLAHDVYVALGEKWGLPMFDNIAAAETRHTQAVAALLGRYEYEDPAKDSKPGRFTDVSLQQLHDALVERGSKSLADALKVGAEIEEMDIADIRLKLDRTEEEDVRIVYERLLCGSSNHLRAFDRQMARRQIAYEPKHLDGEAYETILAARSGPCGQHVEKLSDSGSEAGAEQRQDAGHGNCRRRGQGRCGEACADGQAANAEGDDAAAE